MAFHHGDLERAALDAAYSNTLNQPHDQLSVRELATYLGVTPRAIYRHFGDREGLIRRVAAKAFVELCGEVEASLKKAESGARRAMIGAYCDFALGSPTRYQLMFGLGSRVLREEQTLRPGVFGLIALAERAVQADGLTLEGKERRDHIIEFWGMTHGLLDLYFSGTIRAASPQLICDYIIDRVSGLLAQ